MPKKAMVMYKDVVGPFRKVTRDYARTTILIAYDGLPIKSEMAVKALNLRLKGATVQQFVEEREQAIKNGKTKNTLPTDQRAQSV